MSKYSIKFPNDERYFSDQRIFLTTQHITLLENFLKGSLKNCHVSVVNQNQKKCIEEFIDLVKTQFNFDPNIKSNAHYYNSQVVGGYYLDIPFKKVMETEEVNYHNRSLEKTIQLGLYAKNELHKVINQVCVIVFSHLQPSQNNLPYNASYLENPYKYLMDFIKNISFSVPRNFPKSLQEAIVIEDDPFTQYVERTAYAIFIKSTRQDEKEGFFGGASGNKKLGTDLANARTFNSAKLAEKCVKQNHYYIGDNYAIVEIAMRMKKVVTYKKPIEQLDAALAMMEKERIEKFFEENSLEVIETKLNELKTKKSQILDDKAKFTQEGEESGQRRRNKI